MLTSTKFVRSFCERGDILQNKKLRIAWIIPNVFFYLMFIGALIFVAVNAKDINEIGMMSLWIFILFLLFVGSVLGSIRIWYWIENGKM